MIVNELLTTMDVLPTVYGFLGADIHIMNLCIESVAHVDVHGVCYVYLSTADTVCERLWSEPCWGCSPCLTCMES